MKIKVCWWNYLSCCCTVIDWVLMDDFHVFDEIPRTHSPANLEPETVLIKQECIETVNKECICAMLCITFQPVALKVFPALPTVMVRSHIPGRLAVGNTSSWWMAIWRSVYPVKLWLCLTYLYMFVSVISEPLVDLVAEAQQVMFNTQVGNHLEFLHFVNLQHTQNSNVIIFFHPSLSEKLFLSSGFPAVWLCRKSHLA